MRYFDSLIAARRAGVVGDHVHLGLVAPGEPPDLNRAQEAMARHHLMALQVAPGQHVVDVGCGFGGSLRLLDEALSPLRLTGVNIDPRQIGLARERAWRNPVDWRLCDAAAFSDAEGWADRILCLEAMFHFPDLPGFFAACARALRPGGRMVASTILLQGGAGEPSRRAVADGFAPWPHPDLTLPELIALAGQAGLALVSVADLAPLCRPAFDLMSPPCPPVLTDDPVIELRRLFEAGWAAYPMLVLVPAQAGGKTQK